METLNLDLVIFEFGRLTLDPILTISKTGKQDILLRGNLTKKD